MKKWDRLEDQLKVYKKIVDKAGNELKANEVGEIVAKGKNIMCGYLNSPNETMKILKKG